MSPSVLIRTRAVSDVEVAGSRVKTSISLRTATCRGGHVEAVFFSPKVEAKISRCMKVEAKISRSMKVEAKISRYMKVEAKISRYMKVEAKISRCMKVESMISYATMQLKTTNTCMVSPAHHDCPPLTYMSSF